MHPVPPGQRREGKAVVFHTRYYPSLTQTADQAKPVMDGKWTAVDRRGGQWGPLEPDGDTPNSQVLFCQ